MKIETVGRGKVCGNRRRYKRAHLGDEEWVLASTGRLRPFVLFSDVLKYRRFIVFTLFVVVLVVVVKN
jgi:hypothetical protein